MKYWGKYRKDSDGREFFHLLPWHCLDVAAVGYWMVKDNIFSIRDFLSELGIREPEKAQGFFAWLLCWHDIGKYSLSFQQAVDTSHPDFQRTPKRQLTNVRHDSLGEYAWKRYLKKKEGILPDSGLTPGDRVKALEPWIAMTTGHHGVPPCQHGVLDNFVADDINAMTSFLRDVRSLFPEVVIPSAWLNQEYRDKIKTLSWLISAVIVLADWLGSSEKFFPWSEKETSLTNYWELTLRRAEMAVKVFPPTPKPAPFTGIKSLFSFIEVPTPLQQKVLELPIDPVGPQLFILEDVTGAGKTEAALTLANRIVGAGKARGVFFALPTKATSNAIYYRLTSVFRHFFQSTPHPSLILAHSSRQLVDGFIKSLWTESLAQTDIQDHDLPEAFGCAGWFADNSKKALLADVGVGTIDQILAAVMPFRHNNLRLLGLRNKVIVIDEIHAYDAYMSALLRELISVQARLGNSVILLSATLSQAQRDEYSASFYDGLGLEKSTPRLGLNDYPWITALSQESLISEHVNTRKEVQRTVEIGWVDSEESGLDLIENKASEGKCVGWIKNSVDEAIELYLTLIHRGRVKEENVILFHSRFAAADRQTIEDRTLRSFGKKSAEERAGKAIIATQVIEQSLDIDLDELITDLAPIDLLIQRAGRLRRHIRDSRGCVKEFGTDERGCPKMYIRAPVWSDEPAEDWLKSSMPKSSYVYPEHGKMWLTQKVLREEGAIRMPHDARFLIESVYGVEVVAPKGLELAEDREQGRKYSDIAIANQNVVKLGRGYISNSNYSDTDISTRLSADSLSLILATNKDGEWQPYALAKDQKNCIEMSTLTVRKAWWKSHEKLFQTLEGESLKEWCRKYRQKAEFTMVLLVGEGKGYYSRILGLNAKAEE